jgi:uncharacterized protein YrrD
MFWVQAIGTVPGLSFVMLSSSGWKAIKTGDVWPLIAALELTGILVTGSTWYHHRCTLPAKAVETFKKSDALDSQDSQDG